MPHLEILDKYKMKNTKIFILAGGFGTRLQSVVSDVPKPMAPIIDKPFLDYQIFQVREYFPDAVIYLLTYYKSEIIENYYKNDKSIKIIKENQPLGTGGSIKNGIKTLELQEDSSLLVLNGDTYIKPNLTNMIKTKKYDITILSSFQKECDRYGTLKLQDGIIIGFNEKVDNCKNSYINAGCYFFNSLKFFIDIVDDSFAIEYEFKNYLENKKISAYKYDDIFIDIGIPSDYKKMINYVSKNG
ncbi:MAG: sugar phosphate nucleotidyltransferase [Campylobacterota bacterium]|nr:sugar phosphate nucleotidyltransferase [Campylobacterota bacterium]